MTSRARPRDEQQGSQVPTVSIRPRYETCCMPLYSYCLRYDGGAAPNPYWGVCTLVICKGAIRRTAERGDWVVGLGSKASPIGDISGQVVYAMRVTDRMTMREYNRYCRGNLPGKIPKWRSGEFKKRVGDCVYDFSKPGRPRIRQSVHDERNRIVDLRGKNALLSEHFYYFGNRPRPLPKHLRPIVQQTQGNKSVANAPYVNAFVEWIEALRLQPNRLYGEPQLKYAIMARSARSVCSRRDLEEDNDEEIC